MAETRTLRRARPWLGTLVEIRACGSADVDLTVAIEAAYAEIAKIHDLLSFHNVGSELSRLNRDAGRSPQSVHPHTLNVMRWALRVARDSAGIFDPCVAASLVADEVLPPPPYAPAPHPEASWRDIHISDDDRIRFDRALWVDLGGIAKGYAVDCAIAQLRAAGVTQACVNAGGDLRVFGPISQTIHVRMPHAPTACVPALELVDGAVASSAAYFEPSQSQAGAHRHGVSLAATDSACAAIVVAPRCMLADALTKVVLAEPTIASGMLQAYGAEAQRYDGCEWHRIRPVDAVKAARPPRAIRHRAAMAAP